MSLVKARIWIWGLDFRSSTVYSLLLELFFPVFFFFFGFFTCNVGTAAFLQVFTGPTLLV